MFRAQLRRRPPPTRGPNLPRRRQISLPVVRLDGATFYRQYPSPTDTESSNAPVLRDVSFALPNKKEYWAVVSPASHARTAFMQTLDGKYVCLPPKARSYPYLMSKHITEARLRTPEHAIKYVGFDAERGGLGGTAVKGAYLSARYEAHREVTDWSVLDYLEGNTQLNPLEKSEDAVDRQLLQQVIANLNLANLLSMPVSNLSNGQTRRARIAKALLTKPVLLLLDGPFMGLDPITAQSISRLLRDMAQASQPRLLLSLRPEEAMPEWITHVVYLDSSLNILAQGDKDDVFNRVIAAKKQYPEDSKTMINMRQNSIPPSRRTRTKLTPEHTSRDNFNPIDPPNPPGEALVEMEGVKVSYGAQDSSSPKTVLGDWTEDSNGEQREGLWWTLHRGERWGIFGPNGSGKTTFLSLITSDHPQTYGLPIKLFGRSRLPAPGEAGISIFELQSRMGHSSPELHTYFPKHLSIRRVLESAFADAPLLKPRLSHAVDKKVNAFLRWFAPELSPTRTSVLQDLYNHPSRGQWRRNGELKRRLERMAVDTDDIDWADTLTLRDLSFSNQRLLLFLRALVASPDLVILDEAFSGMDQATRDKAFLFLSHGETYMDTPRITHNGYRFETSILKDTDVLAFEGLTKEQALVNISHEKRDVPGCVRHWICLPEPGDGKAPKMGVLEGPLDWDFEGWDRIWGVERRRRRSAGDVDGDEEEGDVVVEE